MKERKEVKAAATANGKIDQIIDKYQGDSSALIQVLLEIQSENHWLPNEALEKVSKKLEVPLNQIQHVATFYKAFSLVPLKFSLETVNCLGCCAMGPVMVVDGKYHGKTVPAKVDEVLKNYD